VSPVKYELGSYIPEDDILHSHCRENLRSYLLSPHFTSCPLSQRVSEYPVQSMLFGEF
jgi:hypothetical protein